MEGYSFDIHIHSSISRDARQSPENILFSAKRRGLSAIAITDHNSYGGASIAQKAATHSDFVVIPGEEISTEYGDIIGLFLNEEIKSRTFAEVIDEIRNQGGLAIMPHPQRRKHMPPQELLWKIDIIETLNGRSSVSMNNMAEKLAVQLKKPGICGSDAHFSWEIGQIRNISSDPFTSIDDLFRIIVTNRFIQSGTCESILMRKANMGLSYILKKTGELTR